MMTAHRPALDEKRIISAAGFSPTMYHVVSNLNGILTIRHRVGEKPVIRKIDIATRKPISQETVAP